MYFKEIKVGLRVKVVSSNKRSYQRLIGKLGTIVTNEERIYDGEISVVLDNEYNKDSKTGVFWFTPYELEVMEEENMRYLTGFNKVAVVRLIGESTSTAYNFALYDTEYELLMEQNKIMENSLVVVNPISKDNRCLAKVIDIKDVESDKFKVTAQVVAVVDQRNYFAREVEAERLRDIAKKKMAVEEELQKEITKINNIALYEKMASEHPENTKLTELVNELKSLSEEHL